MQYIVLINLEYAANKGKEIEIYFPKTALLAISHINIPRLNIKRFNDNHNA